MHHRRGILTNGKRPLVSWCAWKHKRAHVVYVNEFVHQRDFWFVSEKEAKNTRVVRLGATFTSAGRR